MINAMILAYESCKDRFDRPITFDEFSAMILACLSIIAESIN